MALFVAVLLASVVLRAEASPVSPRVARDINFDIVMPGIHDVPLAGSTTAEGGDALLFLDSLPKFTKASKPWDGMIQLEKPQPGEVEEARPGEEEEARPGVEEEARPGEEEEAWPGVEEEARPGEEEEAWPGVEEEARPGEDVGSGAANLMFPTVSSQPPAALNATREAAEGSGSFAFPSPISLGEEVPPRSVRTEGECALSKGMVLFNGSCEQLLARNNCAEDEWLVLLEGVAQCTPRPCPWGKIPFEEDCVDPLNLSVCDKGQVLYIDFEGNSVCDCDLGFLYDPSNGNCNARHEKGSCPFGEYVDVSASGMVECVPNPCVSNGYVKGEDGCYRKMYGGFCEDANLLFHKKNNTAECRKVALHNILDVTELRDCPAGSIRDYLNVCRETFHFSTLSSYPTLYGGCPGGFARDPSGTCRKLSTLFGR
ncbi:uncharacterized protein LOC134786883 [Penaeus indicus]|uniref:uncharacterized protein LOC134786883 n=1 Tax=Penaeus indicus TaxID=29960 RepID=UPI00300D9607